MPTKSLDFGLFTIKSFYLKAFHPGNFFTYTHRGVYPGCGPGWFYGMTKWCPLPERNLYSITAFHLYPTSNSVFWVVCCVRLIITYLFYLVSRLLCWSYLTYSIKCTQIMIRDQESMVLKLIYIFIFLYNIP